MPSDGALIVDTGLNNSGFLRGAKAFRAALEGLKNTVNRTGRDMAQAGNGYVKSMSQASKEARALNQEIKQLEAQSARLQKSMSGDKMYSTDFKALTDEISQVEAKIKQLQARRQEWSDLGLNYKGEAFTNLEQQISELMQQMDQLNAKRQELLGNGGAYTSEHGALQAEFANIQTQLQGLRQRRDALQQIGQTGGKTAEELDRVSESAGRARSSIAAIAGGAVKNGFHKLLGVVQKLGKAIASLFHRSRGGGNFFSVKNLLAYGLGIRSLYALFSRLRTAVKDGLGSLAEYDPRVRAAVNSMSTALSSLKGSLSTAFAPILTAVAPALITLINLLTRAVNAIGMFIAALTGQSFYTVAAGVSAVGGAAKGSSGAVKDLKRQLAGFDELNILSDTSGGGGGGGGGGGLGGLEYTKVPIADWLNEAIQNDNFALIGQKLAQKLNESLDKIDWDAIKRRAKDIVRKLTDILNGFIGEINPQSLGRTLAGVLNTAAAIVGDFFDRTKWEDLGRVVKDSLMDALRRLSAKDIARALLAPIKAGINYLKGLLPKTTPEWHKITSKLVSILVKAIKDFPATDLGDVIGRLINGAFSLIKDLADARTLTNIAKKIVEAIQAAIKRIDLNLIKNALISFLQDAWEALKVLIGLKLNIGGVNVPAWAVLLATTALGSGIIKLFGGLFGAGAGGKGLSWKGAALIGAIGFLIEAALGVSDLVKSADGLSQAQITDKVWNILKNVLLAAGFLTVRTNPIAGVVTIGLGLVWEFAQEDIKDTLENGLLPSAQSDTYHPGISMSKLRDDPELKHYVENTQETLGHAWDKFRIATGLDIPENEFNMALNDYVVMLDEGATLATASSEQFGAALEYMAYSMQSLGAEKPDMTWKNFFDYTSSQRWGYESEKKAQEEAQKNAGAGRSDVLNNPDAFHIPTVLDPPSESAFQQVKQSILDWFNTKMEPIKAKVQAVLEDDNASSLEKTLANTVLNIDATVKTFLEKGWSGSVAKALGIPQEVYVGISLTKGSNGTVTMVVDSKNKTASVKAGSNAKPGTIIVTPAATGGVFANGFWRALPQYARGTASAHGSLFLAGEAGPEIVGHVGGRTEVLNKSQLAATMFAAVRSAMQGVQVNVDLGEIASASWMDKLAAHIGNYQAPAMASGSVLPYDVAAQIAKTGQDIQTAMDANTDDLIQTIVSVAGQIVAALNRPQPTGGQSGATAQDVINEINRRTLMFGASPLQGV